MLDNFKNKLWQKILGAFILVVGGFVIYAYPRYEVPIIMFHSVAATDIKKLNTIPPEMFEKQVAFLKNQGYHVINLIEYIDGLRQGKSFSRQSVVITFDDGYRDTFTAVYPILKKYQFPATVFIVSDLIDDPQFLSQEQIRTLAQEGWTIGNHSKSHEYLPLKSTEQLKEQLIHSKIVLEQVLGHPVQFFSYPCGGYSQNVVSMLQAAGYQAAVTTNRGVRSVPWDLFALKRIRVNSSDSDLVLRAKLSGYYNFFRRPKAPYKPTDVDVTCPCHGTPAE